MDTSAPGDASVAPALIWRVYKVPILLGSVSLLCIALSITLFIKSYQAATPITFSSSSEAQALDGSVSGSIVENTLSVDTEGAVVNPGVYQLPMGSRVEDAIAAAGGLSIDADVDAMAKVLNRAAKVSDGAKLYIPKVGESVSSGNPTSRSSSDLGSLGNLVNVNSSTQEQLEALNGIGPATANKIIAGRPYQTLEELVSKKAMSQSLMTKLKDQLTL